MFAAFHWSVIGIALFVQIGKKRTNWKYLWTIPIIYSVIAGLEALIAGSVTGAMSVFSANRDSHPPGPRAVADVTSQAQGRCYLHSGRVVHDDLDTVHLGLGQCLRAGRLVFLYFGWSVNTVDLSTWPDGPYNSPRRRRPLTFRAPSPSRHLIFPVLTLTLILNPA